MAAAQEQSIHGIARTPGPNKYEMQLDFITLLDKSEKHYQARMIEIFQKYDRPFLNDIVVNIEDLTIDTPEGRRPWNFETNMLEDMKTPSVRKCQYLGSRKLVSCDSPETSFSECSKKEKGSTPSKVDPFSGQTCKYLEENTDANDHKRIVSTQTSDLSIIRQKLRVALSLKESPGKYNVTSSQADTGPSPAEESSYSEPGNKTLVDCYPKVFQNLCNIWDLHNKNQAADNIVWRYKRLIWCKNKKLLGMKTLNRRMSKSMNKTYAICPAPKVEETKTVPETYHSRLLLGEHYSKPGLGGSSKTLSPNTSLFSQAIPATLQKIANNIFDSQNIYIDSPFQDQQQKKINSVMSPGYNSRASSNLCKMSISSSKDITNKSQMDIEIAQFQDWKDSKRLQQNALDRRNSFSGFPTWQSPKNEVAKNNCNINLTKAKTAQSKMEVAERNYTSYKEHIRQLNKTCTLTRRNSFSVFPVGHNANKDFESLYRNLNQARTQPFFSSSKFQVQLSKTVSSLVNSPGSLRAKRQPSHDFSFSPSKKPRNATEALIGRSKLSFYSTDSSDLLYSKPNSSPILHHSVFAPVLPTRMLPQSPVSHKSFSNGETPKRINSRRLIYQEDNGTVAGN
ncbi:uncharacterized protein LOC142196186 [Leptodactylus fuscus]|uniref:uncharacterized protein LOC142196186 n=1 Tax=Leptodactylus fuscus TaxID=238119 RepID=UPI003F4F0887